MAEFWRSGDLSRLPRNPSVGVALEWVVRMTGTFGYEIELARLGLTHQEVMDRILQPAEDGQLDHLADTHPLILLHCLWRISVQYGRVGYGDTTVPIDTVDWIATRHIWAALLQQLASEPARIEFITSEPVGEWGPEVVLGSLEVGLDPRAMLPGIARVMTDADFSSLPEDADWKDIGDLALLIDGYTLVEQLPEVGELFDWFNPLWEAHLDEGAPLPESSLHLWLMLFACQRAYLRDIWDSENPDGSPSDIARGIRALYQALRLTLQHEAACPNTTTPLYVVANR